MPGSTDLSVVGESEESALTRWRRDGYVVVPGLLSSDDCGSLSAAAAELLAVLDSGGDAHVVARFENTFDRRLPPSVRISKLIRISRTRPFDGLSLRSGVQRLLHMFVGENVDEFLTQLVFKYPGAYGQPWHQDAALFPFEPPRPVIAIWIPLTDARGSTLEVMPGSHRWPVRPHGHDRGDSTRGRYLALEDQGSESATEVVVVSRGDAVVFDSHLVHRSLDNSSDVPRLAAVYHFATAGTTDRTVEVFGQSPFNEWVPVRRNGHAVDRQVGPDS